MKGSGLSSNKKVAYYRYNFAKHDGAVGAISVPGDPIPAGAIICGGRIHVTEALTSGGSATIAIEALSTADLKAATAVATYALNAILATIPVNTAASDIRVTANITALVFTVAVAALLTGKAVVALDYIVTA